MSNSAAKEPPVKEETSPLSSLPDEMALSCLARVSRSDHAALSLVSKKYRSLVASPELYKTRSLLGRTKECLYVGLSTEPYSIPSWYVLHRENTNTLEPAAAEKTLKKLIPIPSFPPQRRTFSSFVVLDWGIYVIGGFKNVDVRTSGVLLLDGRTNTWRKVASMKVGRAAAAAGVVDGKIYVFGGCEEVDSSNWAEVFDPKTETWETLEPMSDRNEGDNVIRETLVMEQKIYAVEFWSGNLLCYSPYDGKWGRKTPKIQSYYCVTENVLYGSDEVGNVFWLETEELEWKKVKGLEALEKIFPSLAVRATAFTKRVKKLSNFGVNIVVFWVGRSGDVWCAEISLERRKEEGEIWGTIEWTEAVTTFEYNIFTRVPVEVLYSATVYV